MHHVDCAKVQAAKRRSYARYTRTVLVGSASQRARSPWRLHMKLRGKLTCMSMSGFSVGVSAVCANKPGSSRRHQAAFILRLRSAVRGCRRDIIGLFGVIPILAMHMRISRRFAIPELADHTHEIKL
jgi:hypothetical protein